MKRPVHPKEARNSSLTCYSVAKIVLLGDARVGKSALACRLAGGAFVPPPTNHPTQFRILPISVSRPPDRTKCEIVLWDMASQPDYRLVHPLSITDADLALLVFDPTERPDPMRPVYYWLSQLSSNQQPVCQMILVAARSDVGGMSLIKKDIDQFCKVRGIAGGFIVTSAATGEGIPQLLEKIDLLLRWERVRKISVPEHFDQIKDYVLACRMTAQKSPCFPSLKQLCRRLAEAQVGRFEHPDLLESMQLLQNYGYVRVLDGGPSDIRVLMAPELFDALAASFVRQARQHERGLGALEEDWVLSNRYGFPELRGLSICQQQLLLQSVLIAFLEGRLAVRCQRELIGAVKLLLFPELVTLKRPTQPDMSEFQDDVSYRVVGEVDNLFAVMVVSIGYTNTARKSEHWQEQAHYELGEQEVCGFRQEEKGDREVTFVLYFGSKVREASRALFCALFEGFLTRRKLTVVRCEPLVCEKCGYLQDRTMVQRRRREGKSFTYCSECRNKLAVPEERALSELDQLAATEVRGETLIVQERTRFESAIAQLRIRLKAQQVKATNCFISYAWGDLEHERWVEQRLAKDLESAGIAVLLDRWVNAQIGSSVPRFVERVDECGYVVVVGTPLYRKKAKNVVSPKGSVVAAELDLIGIRLLATEDQKRTVLPVLLAGDESESLPPLLRGRVYGDFRSDDAYFTTAFDLILSLYRLPPNHPAVADLRESLRGSQMS